MYDFGLNFFIIYFKKFNNLLFMSRVFDISFCENFKLNILFCFVY